MIWQCATTWLRTAGRSIQLVAVAIVLAAPGQAFAHSLSELEQRLLTREPYVEIVDRETPDFALKAANGDPVSLQDLRGKVVVLWFIYASCPDFCPLHSEALAAIQAEVNRTPMRDLVRFVSITTDPVRDTPQVMTDYGPAHGLDSTNWLFLTSGAAHPSGTHELAERFGLKFTATPDGLQMHGIVTHMIDRKGRMRARYHGLNFNQTNVILHINALTHDYH